MKAKGNRVNQHLIRMRGEVRFESVDVNGCNELEEMRVVLYSSECDFISIHLQEVKAKLA